MSQVLVSIIIPTYNREHLIGETLISLLNQKYQNWECIIVDDGSTDNTEKAIDDFIQKDNRFNLYKRENLPKGASHCRNIGLTKAKGAFVIFLDSDDQLLDFCLAQRMQHSIEFPNKDFYVFPMLVETNSNVFIEKKIPLKDDYLIEFLKYKLHWQTMCTFWEVNFLKGINGFDINYPRLNDPEIHIRALLKSKNFKVFNTAKPDSEYRLGETKNYSSLAKKYNETLQLFIPDTISNLDKHNKKKLKKHLKGYLITWLNHFLKFANKHEKRIILQLFKKNGVINFIELCLVTIYLFLDLQNNKLTIKSKSQIIKYLKTNDD